MTKDNFATSDSSCRAVRRRLGLAIIGAFGALAVAAAAAAQDTGSATGALATNSLQSGRLPHDLSPWSMFLTADVIVKAVMISLAVASVVTWTVLLAKSLELLAAKRRIHAGMVILGAARTLREATQQFQMRGCAIAAMIGAAVREVALSADIPGEGLKERVASRLERIEAAASRAVNRGTGVLATIGATAPFVGLFGTVWGIMNSFIGISKAETTNLAIVAPGIAEALLATALGLVAAIPAVVIYNHFVRQISSYRALVADASAEVLRLVSRDLDRQQGELTLSRVAE